MKYEIIDENNLANIDGYYVIKGTSDKMYSSDLVIMKKNDGSYQVIKNRGDLSTEAINQIILTHKNNPYSSPKKETVKRLFKVKHKGRVVCWDKEKYVWTGTSKEGFPIYAVEIPTGECFHLNYRDFTFGDHNVCPEREDFEWISYLEDDEKRKDDFEWVKTSDYVMEHLGRLSKVPLDKSNFKHQSDERLLLI